MRCFAQSHPCVDCKVQAKALFSGSLLSSSCCITSMSPLYAGSTRNAGVSSRGGDSFTKQSEAKQRCCFSRSCRGQRTGEARAPRVGGASVLTTVLSHSNNLSCTRHFTFLLATLQKMKRNQWNCNHTFNITFKILSTCIQHVIKIYLYEWDILKSFVVH